MSVGISSTATSDKKPEAEAGSDAIAAGSSIVKLYVRGTISNSLGLSILYALHAYLDLGLYVALALGVQYLVFFLHGLPQKSEKFYDLSGSFTHLTVVFAALAFGSADSVRSPRQLFAAVASIIWMTRLGTFLYNRILQDGKDGRFDALKRCWLSFMGAWTIQAVWVTLVELPVVLVLLQTTTSSDSSGLTFSPVVDAVLAFAWLAGFLIEACADSEKMAFNKENKGRWVSSGLWRYSRHPNYFGEILMWSSLAALASYPHMMGLISGATSGTALALSPWLSPAFTALLLFRVTGVAPLERSGMKKWGSEAAYVHYMKNTSCMVPWFPAKPSAADGVDSSSDSKDKQPLLKSG